MARLRRGEVPPRDSETARARGPLRRWRYHPHPMRTTALTPLLILAGCSIIAPPPPPPAPAPVPVPAAPAAYGFKLDEEVKLLQIEDRRQYYAPLVDWGIHHPNALHRARMALALGRIGPH